MPARKARLPARDNQEEAGEEKPQQSKEEGEEKLVVCAATLLRDDPGETEHEIVAAAICTQQHSRCRVLSCQRGSLCAQRGWKRRSLDEVSARCSFERKKVRDDRKGGSGLRLRASRNPGGPDEGKGARLEPKRHSHRRFRRIEEEAQRAEASWSSPRRRSGVIPSVSTKIEALILQRWLPKNARGPKDGARMRLGRFSTL